MESILLLSVMDRVSHMPAVMHLREAYQQYLFAVEMEKDRDRLRGQNARTWAYIINKRGILNVDATNGRTNGIGTSLCGGPRIVPLEGRGS